MIPKLRVLVAFICLNSTALIESTSIPSNAVACYTREKCEEKYRAINPNGYLYVSEYRTKGCFIKGKHGFFGTGGTAEEMEESDLPGDRERIWCDKYTIGVYYYPWHSNNFHNGEGYLRRNLEPPQLPQLGEYDDTDPSVISQHLKWSRYANVNLWVSSWWGPDYQEDKTLKSVILPHTDLPGTRIALLYETTSRMKQGIKNNITDIFYQDMEYIANTYFDDPNHYRIDNRPVLFVYLTRVLSREGILETVTTQMRQAALDNGGHDVYIIGDQVMGNAPNDGKEYEPFVLLDGVTNYDVYGNLKRPNNGYAGINRLNDLVTRNRRWRNEARAGGCAFIPAVAPGYNDRGVRFDAGHTPLSRKLYKGAPEGSLFRTSLEKTLDLTDESTERLLMITSWNEWHEDTQIEPVVNVGQTDQPLNMTCYGEQCNEGLEYKAYGELYLDILRNVTAINNGRSEEGVGRERQR